MINIAYQIVDNLYIALAYENSGSATFVLPQGLDSEEIGDIKVISKEIIIQLLKY